MATILYIGLHNEILNTVVRLIKARDGFSAIGSEPEEARTLFREHHFDLVLLGCGLDDETETQLTNYFNSEKPSVPVIKHYGGGSGLLWAEILTGLENMLE